MNTKIGEFIKVWLPFYDPDFPNCKGETPWAVVTQILSTGNILARLDNEPIATDLHGHSYNDIVELHVGDDGRWTPAELGTAH